MTRDHRRAHLCAWFLIAATVTAVWVAVSAGGIP